jgi:integrase
MGRPRKHDKHLPRHLMQRRGAYYYVIGGVWSPLGRDYGEALRTWADLEGRQVPKGRTVADALAYYIIARTPDLSPKTVEAYKVSEKKLVERFGPIRLDALRPEQVTGYLRTAKSKVSANRDKALLSAAYAWVNGEGWLTVANYNPARVRRNPEKPRRRYVTDAELEALLAHAGPKLALMIELSYITGIRKGDLLRLRLADAREDGLHVTQGKTGAQQVFEWTDGLRRIVDAAKGLRRTVGSLWLFPAEHRPGEPMTALALRTAWERARGRAGLGDVRWHDLRRKAGSDAAAGDAQAMLGHADGRITHRHYRAKPAVVRPLR